MTDNGRPDVVHQFRERMADDEALLQQSSTVDEIAPFEFFNSLAALDVKAADRGELLDSGFVYIIEADGLGLFKIGKSVDVHNRISHYRTACPVACTTIFVARVPLRCLDHVERSLHRAFSDVRYRGEWFRLSGDHIQQLQKTVETAIAKDMRAVDREVTQKALTYDVYHVQEWRAAAIRMQKSIDENAVPTSDLIMDRIMSAWQDGEHIYASDLKRRTGRPPRVIHDILRGLLVNGDVAIVSPTRHPSYGSFWLDTYKQCKLIIPDVTCDWEMTCDQYEIQVSEPLGRPVPEFFGRSR